LPVSRPSLLFRLLVCDGQLRLDCKRGPLGGSLQPRVAKGQSASQTNREIFGYFVIGRKSHSEIKGRGRERKREGYLEREGGRERIELEGELKREGESSRKRVRGEERGEEMS
jgi:hypothetical protein